MGSEFDDVSQRNRDQDVSLRALAFEIKNPLINIARQAEVADAEALTQIQHTAEQALRLIDSYLLNAQTEYGQMALDLTPTVMGSVLYDVSAQLRASAVVHNTELIIDDRVHEPVMTHRIALGSVLTVFGNILMEMGKPRIRQQIVMRGYKTRRGGLGIGIFSETKLSSNDLNRALKLQGRAHMPLSEISSSSHASLAIAEGLCRAIGGKMTVKRMGSLNGLATELPCSEQLAFV